MIKRALDMNVEQIPEMRGGKLTTTLSHFASKEEVMDTGRLFSIITLPPGGSVGYHQHVGDFEIYRIMAGEGTVMDSDKKEHVLYPGDVMICEDGEFHSIENTGKEELSFLALILYSK